MSLQVVLLLHPERAGGRGAGSHPARAGGVKTGTRAARGTLVVGVKTVRGGRKS